MSNESTPDEMSSFLENTRQPAQRLSAVEIRNVDHQVVDSNAGDEDTNPPNLALTGTGGAVNRVQIAGTLTEVSNRGSKEEPYYRARIVTPTGTVFAYAGQYQPEAQAWLQNADTPAYIMCVGKLRLLEDDDGDTFTSIRPEWIQSCSGVARNRWAVNMANETMNRIEATLESDGVTADNLPSAVYEDRDIDLSREGMQEYLDAAITALEDVSEVFSGESESEADAEADDEVYAEADQRVDADADVDAAQDGKSKAVAGGEH